MDQRRALTVAAVALALLALAQMGCSLLPTPDEPTPGPAATPIPTQPPTLELQVTPSGSSAPTAADEPFLITGAFTYTSPFFAYGLRDGFILLEDQAGFVNRDKEFTFSPISQALGPIQPLDDDTLTYNLLLPAVPQATLVDVDNDDEAGTGVQIFALAFWSNTWGDPFLEPRDGSGWSNAYASTVTDPERDDEITGGILIVWAPDGEQGFPTGFGEDGLLFTDDDPVAPIPAGYSIVNLDEDPFTVEKKQQVDIDLNEGVIAVNDYSEMSYNEAFDAMFEQIAREYPFTADKDVDWEALYDEFAPRVAGADDAQAFYLAIRDFTWAIPDAHIGIRVDPDVFFEEQGGSFGMILAELSDGRVIVKNVLPDTPAAEAGIEVGAEIVAWDGTPVEEALAEVTPYFGPYSTDHHKRLEQVSFLTRVPPFEAVDVTYRNPGASARETRLTATIEYESLFQGLPYFAEDPLALPIQGEVLDDSGLGYLNISTFSANYKMMTDLWDHYMNAMIEQEIPGLIIDVRLNGGGSGGLALDFAGYFFDEEIPIARRLYYSERTDAFEADEILETITPGTMLYEGPVALLVSPYCVSACEGFSYAMTREGRTLVIGHYPSAGAYGEVGQGQFELPDDLTLQFPTGRPETPDGDLLIEGSGIVPDVVVPVTEESVLEPGDVVLDAAVEALLDQLGR